MMTGSEHIQLAIQHVQQLDSPWGEELAVQLALLYNVTLLHEKTASNPPQGPTETALGHKPKGLTVAGHSVQTDRALEALCESD